MKELLDYVLKGILGKEKYEIKENNDGGRVVYLLKVAPEDMGIIIGKGGRVIKSVRNILKVRATLEKTAVSLNLEE